MVSAVTSHQDWVGPCLLPQRWLRHQQLTAMDDNNTNKKKGSLTCVYKKLSSCLFVLDLFRRDLGQRWAVALHRMLKLDVCGRVLLAWRSPPPGAPTRAPLALNAVNSSGALTFAGADFPAAHRYK